MPTNDFKALAEAAGANVITQAAYLTLLGSTLANGNVDGIFPSDLANKQLRQATTIAAAVAQMMSDFGNQDVLDTDGNLAVLISELKQAMIRRPIYTDSSGSANTYTMVAGAYPLPPAVLDGMKFSFLPAHTNTGASTLSGTALKRADGTACSGGEVVANVLCTVQYSATDTAYLIVGTTQAATADVIAGTSPSLFVSPASLLGAVGVSALAILTGRTVVPGGTINFAHGLPRRATQGAILLKCTSNDSGYTTGEWVWLTPYIWVSVGVAYQGFGVFSPDATHTTFIFAQDALDVLNPSTGVSSHIDTTKWTADLYVWG